MSSGDESWTYGAGWQYLFGSRGPGKVFRPENTSRGEEFVRTWTSCEGILASPAVFVSLLIETFCARERKCNDYIGLSGIPQFHHQKKKGGINKKYKPFFHSASRQC